MNFLSHYYSLKEENPYFILGAVMPDIVKDFSKIYNKYIEGEFFPEELINSNMLKGVKNHIKADALFHEHILFEKMQEIAKKEMKITFQDTLKRQFVVAHVLIELIIDQYVMNANDCVLDDFYKKINEIDLNEANKFYIDLAVDEENSHFKRNFTNFRESKFLFHLKRNEGIIFTLNKVFSKKLQYDFVRDEKKWDKTIKIIKSKIEELIPQILEDVKTKLYE